MIFANLRESPAGTIRKTVAHDGLDQSEKSAISYFFGLTFAKLTATQLLGVHWVMHLDVYAQYLQPTFVGASPRRRPDLVGRDASGRWYVLEAKGRTNKMTSQAVIKNAKAQTKALRSIRGVAPHLRVASISHFVNQALSVHWEDPVGVDEEAFDLDISETQFTKDYYRPFVDLVTHNRAESMTIDGQKVHVVAVPDADLRIGLNEEMLDIVADKKGGRLLPQETTRSLDESKGFLIENDGIVVVLGETWSPDMMALEPGKRRG